MGRQSGSHRCHEQTRGPKTPNNPARNGRHNHVVPSRSGSLLKPRRKAWVTHPRHVDPARVVLFHHAPPCSAKGAIANLASGAGSNGPRTPKPQPEVPQETTSRSAIGAKSPPAQPPRHSGNCPSAPPSPLAQRPAAMTLLDLSLPSINVTNESRNVSRPPPPRLRPPPTHTKQKTNPNLASFRTANHQTPPRDPHVRPTARLIGQKRPSAQHMSQGSFLL